MFDSTEQRIADQARAMRKNGWLSELELQMIRRRIEKEDEESRWMENTTRSGGMDQNVVDEVGGGLENGQNIDFIVNEIDEHIPPEVRTIIDQARRLLLRVQVTTIAIHLRKLTTRDWKKKLGIKQGN